MAKKKNKEPKPASMSYEPLQIDPYKGYTATAAEMMPVQGQYADLNIEKQVKAQSDLTRNQAKLTQELAPQMADLRVGLNAKYQPVLTQQYLDRIDQADPTFRAVRDRLGARAASDLDAGYSLGDDLNREVEQGIRKAQTARGNWLGPAPAAAEAWAKGSMAVDLNNQRQANARGFLSTRGTSDLFGNFSMMEGYQPVNVITPTGQYVDPSAPFNEMGAQQGFRNSSIAAYGVNQDAQFGTYDRQWDRYLYGSFAAPEPQKKSWLERAMTGAQTGAQEGSAFGPWGAIGGAAGGAVDGAANGPIYKAKMGESGQYK